MLFLHSIDNIPENFYFFLLRYSKKNKRKMKIWRYLILFIKSWVKCMSERRYENLDGLRVICCLAIIAMHVRANTSYEVGGVHL